MKLALTRDQPSPTSYAPLNVDVHLHSQFFAGCKLHITGYCDVSKLVTGLAMPPFPLESDFQLPNHEETKHQLYVGLVNSVINCIKACDESHCITVAEVFLSPLLNSIIAVTIDPQTPSPPSLLLQGYLQVSSHSTSCLMSSSPSSSLTGTAGCQYYGLQTKGEGVSF